MKATGIVRRIDELGRVVIPKEIRRTPRIRSCCRRSGAWGTGCERTMNRPEPFAFEEREQTCGFSLRSARRSSRA